MRQPFKLKLGSALPPTIKRHSCSKCGEKLFFPTSIHATVDGYCGQCRFILRLKHSATYDVEPLGYPKGGNFKNRLVSEPEMFYAKPVEKWYNVPNESSPRWQRMKEYWAKRNRTQGF